MPDIFTYRETAPLIFTSALFWFFFGFVLIAYQFVYRRTALRNVFLMLMSMYFYYLTGGYFFTLLIFSTLVDYYIGREVYRSEDAGRRKKFTALSVVVNLGVLFYFKYAYFFTDTFNGIFETDFETVNYLALWVNNLTDSSFDAGKIILPVGISFYTFQTISYTVDIYRRKVTPVKNIWDFAFYVSFFPQLVAGPIVRASDFVPQLYTKYRLSREEFGRAVFLILAGLTKKIYISDYVSTNFADRVFESPAAYSGFENLTAVYAYAIQIYCDFSGYTDIAIGIALLLGFRLPLNFNSPYKAQNITDFWRRWHISLSSWLRDYLYISMGGNRKGKFFTYLFLMITMLLGGLWHGAAGRFIIWGGLHGAALALHKIWLEFVPAPKKELFVSRLFWGFVTFHFVCFCWIFFRADNLDIVGTMLSRIFTDFRADLIPQFLASYGKIYAVMAAGFIIHWLPSSVKLNIRDTFISLPDFTKAIVVALLVVLLFQVRTAEVQPFIYFQF